MGGYSMFKSKGKCRKTIRTGGRGAAEDYDEYQCETLKRFVQKVSVGAAEDYDRHGQKRRTEETHHLSMLKLYFV